MRAGAAEGHYTGSGARDDCADVAPTGRHDDILAGTKSQRC